MVPRRVTPDAVARDHGISRATACRSVEEVIAVLADQAPDLREALERARDGGFPQVILDGTIICAARCREKTVSVQGELIDVWYSGKARTHGGNIEAVIAPGGFPLWVSVSEPGSVHDITAARIHALPALYRAAATGLPTLADPGYDGAGIGIHIPVKQPADGRELDIGTRTRNALQRSLRCLGERGFALLTGRWRTLQHITAQPQQDQRHRPRRARPHPFRVRLHQMKSLRSSHWPRSEDVWLSHAAGAVRCGSCTLLHLPTG